jgi:anti-anti-sigma factor
MPRFEPDLLVTEGRCGRVSGAADRKDVTRLGHVPLIELAITEELDIWTAPRLSALLDAALALRPERLTIDLAGCPSIDAAAIDVLLEAHRCALRTGGQLTLREPPPRLRRNLRLARVDHVLHITSSAAAGSTT